MDHKQRYEKLRLLVRNVNKKRKQQAQKIDILCNDIIGAQRNFIKQLNTVSFAAGFYNSIVGMVELNSLLHTAGKLIKEQIQDANVAFFLRQAESFELHLFEADPPMTFENQHPQDCFSPELVDNICKSNKICTLDDMFAMGLEGNLNMLNKITAVTIPLAQSGSSLGFILIYRTSQNKLTPAELTHISAVMPGLSRAIASCQVLSSPAD